MAKELTLLATGDIFVGMPDDHPHIHNVVRLPEKARYVLRLMAVVVLPTPPFWLHIAIVLAMLLIFSTWNYTEAPQNLS